MESTPLSFPPSRRGRAVITRDLMMDLSREAEALPVYDEVANPAGLIDITSSINMLMKAEIDELVQTCAQEGHASCMRDLLSFILCCEHKTEKPALRASF